MKLKKLMALALSGVLAVSMFAGCATTSNNGGNGNNGEEEDPPVSGGVSTAVGANVKAYVEDQSGKDKANDLFTYVSFQDDAELSSDLKAVVEYAGVLDVMPDYILSDQTVGVAEDVWARYLTQIGVTDDMWVNNIGSLAVLQAAETLSSKEIPDAVAGDMRVVSGAIGADAVNQLVAEYLVDTGKIDEYLYSTNDEADSTGSNFNHEYTISVSTYTKAVNSSMAGVNVGDVLGIQGGAADPYVTFIAIKVVRTSTHQ